LYHIVIAALVSSVIAVGIIHTKNILIEFMKTLRYVEAEILLPEAKDCSEKPGSFI
jgi:hypothetical protein